MLNIIRHDPVGHTMRDLVSWLERDPFILTPLFETSDEGMLPLDIAEGDGELIVTASLPGFKKEDIDVQIHDGVLSIKAEQTEEKETRDEHYQRRERRIGSLSRRVALPGEVSEDNAQAELTDGVLTLRIPQAEAAKPRQIPIA
jgi:HSP20 family protein